MGKIAVALALASALVGFKAGAATIDIVSFTSGWDSVSAESSAKSTITGIDTSQLKWGGGTPKSGYGFVGAASTGHDVGEEFVLGTFTHYNNPIKTGTSITKATLNLTFDLLIDGTARSISSSFDFNHLETNNSGEKNGRCANGGKNKRGINNKGCADRVTISSVLDLLEEIQIGDAIYTMQITGFLLDMMTGKVAEEFWTREKAANSAYLVAMFTKVEGKLPPVLLTAPPPPSAVPLPATGWLLLAGLGGIAGLRRRRKG